MLYIMTLHWNKRQVLNDLKSSLFNNLDSIDFRWLIRDNNSTDDSINIINSWEDSRVNLIRFSHNKDSFSRGMNFLFKEANPKDDDMILLLNNDIIFNNNTSIRNMIKILQNDSEVGLVGAKLNYLDNPSKLQHCGVLFNSYNGLPFHYRSGVNEAERDRVNRYYPAITGAVALCSGKIYRNCFNNSSGYVGLNEKYFFGFEDIDFCLRIIHHLKKRIVYCGETNILHEESASLKKNPVHKMFFTQNCKIFMEAWYNYINVNLSDKYENPTYAKYIGK